MNIRLRLTLWYTAILFLILVVFGLAVYFGLTRSLLTAVDNHLQREVGEMLGNLKFSSGTGEENDDHQQPLFKGKGLELQYKPEEGVFWRILDPRGQPILDPGLFQNAPLGPVTLTTGQPRFEYAVLADKTPIRLYTAPFVIEQQGTGIIQVAESYHHIQDVQQQLIWLLALIIPFTLLAASAGGWLLATGALAPIDRITRAAAQISAQDLHRRLNLPLPNDEVGRLAATFDSMLARLEAAFAQQKRFIADASHELRTPLTILKGDVEVALNRPRRAEEYRETLELVNQTTDRLAALVEELFLLARTDNNQYPIHLEALNLSNLLTREVSRLLPYAIKKKITLHLNTPETLPLQADPAKLERLFTNLIDNAIKYSNPGDAVTLTANQQGQEIWVSVADTGPGIPAEHLPHLFERFYRADKARARQTANSEGSGAGLGLSIAQWLAQVHGGRLEVASQVGQGATFTVWLPLVPPER